MTTPTQYRRFAEECRRLAQQVESDRHRLVLHEMASAWEALADETEEAGLQPSRDGRSVVLAILGLQIGTQFCPGMMIGNPKVFVGNRIEFFVARKLRRPAGSLKSTYRVVNTTF